MSAIFEVTLTAHTYGGAAMGRLPDGRAVFVPFALPGERVRISLVEEKRGYARARLLEVIQPAAERISPRCRHFGICGGCHYQHLSYDAQLRVKEAILREQLQRIAGLPEPPVLPIVPSPRVWNYRNHVQFHLDPQGRLAYVTAEGEGKSRDLMPVEECYLPEPAINAIWPWLQFEFIPDLERIALRSGAEEALMLVLESRAPQPPSLELETSASVVHLYQEDALVLVGEGYLFQEVGGRLFRVSAGSFFQVNTAMAERLVEHILSLVPSRLDEVWDVYCGVGLFSAFLAERARSLKGIELSPSACEDFVFNLDAFDHVSLYEGAAEEVLPYLEGQPQVVVLDPPRAGLAPAVIDALTARQPAQMIYVSCDAATLARDVGRLMRKGYLLRQVTPFDMFPHTYHIESVALFERG
jgi:23S rRNA (uracil1939-C5)-methyltransferase